MRFSDRRVVVEEPQGTADEVTAESITKFLNESALVIIGDPGMGKTTILRAAAEAANEAVVHAREILDLNPQRYRGRTLYIDGLDEVLPHNGGEPLRELRKVLDRDLDRPKFLLTCRATNWAGRHDVELLSAVVPTGSQLVVVRLLPLSDENIAAIAKECMPRLEFDAFRREAEDRNLEALLGNPQTLLMLGALAENKKDWPTGRTDLFEKICTSLADEHNKLQRRRDPTSPQAILESAGYVCAVLLLSRRNGVAVSSATEQRDFVPLFEFGDSAEQISSACGRRLFLTIAPDHVVPAHRTIEEFLAARYLAKKLANSLSPTRAMTLLTIDGGVPTDLRGLVSWLAIQNESVAAAIIEKDPIAIVANGELAELAPSLRKPLLNALARASVTNPLQVHKLAGSPSARALASVDFEELVNNRILDPQTTDAELELLVRSVALNKKLRPAIESRLLEILRDPSRGSYVRHAALTAFRETSTEPIEPLRALLAEMVAGEIVDPSQSLRTSILAYLPKDRLPAAQLGQLIGGEGSGLASWNRLTILFGLPSAELLPAYHSLIEARRGKESAHSPPRWVIARVISRLVDEHGESATPGDLLSWLSELFDAPEIDPQDVEGLSVRDWLLSHPQKAFDLFEFFVKTSSPEISDETIAMFRQHIGGVTPSPSFGARLLALAGTTTESALRRFLFAEACESLANPSSPDFPAQEALVSFAGSDTMLLEILREHQSSRTARAEELKSQLQQQESEISILRRLVDGHEALENLAGGTDREGLERIANYWRSTNAPFKRLIELLGIEGTDAAANGLLLALRDTKIPSSEMVGQTPFDEALHAWKVELTGFDLLGHPGVPSSWIGNLAEDTVASAVALHAMIDGRDTLGGRHLSLDRLERERPGCVHRGLTSAWRGMLRRGAEELPLISSYERAGGSGASLVQLLQANPGAHTSALSGLISGAIRLGALEQLAAASESILVDKSYSSASARIALTAAGVVGGKSLTMEIGSEDAGAHLWLVADVVEAASNFQFGVAREGVLSLLRDSMQQTQPGEGSGNDLFREWLLPARATLRMIHSLRQSTSSAADDILSLLLKDSATGRWRDHVSNAIDTKRQQARDSAQMQPSLESVLSVLRDGLPANSSDLAAIVELAMRDLATQLRHGADDGYKQFWNTDSYGRPGEPRVETVCRDLLLQVLKIKLQAQDLRGEKEAAFADGKQADMKWSHRQFAIPVEVKRHFHEKLWTAPMDQLRAFYTRDPEASGNGIYLVLWFGLSPVNGRSLRVPPKPDSSPTPVSAVALETDLRAQLPESLRKRIRVVVLDVARAGESE